MAYVLPGASLQFTGRADFWHSTPCDHQEEALPLDLRPGLGSSIGILDSTSACPVRSCQWLSDPRRGGQA
jgi:hypothetical protein